MKWKIEDKIETYNQFNGIMEKYPDDWSQIEQFKTCFDEFVFNLKMLKELRIIYEKDLRELEIDLAKQKKDLITSFNLVLKLLMLYADDNRKANLSKKLEKIKKDLDHLINSELSGLVMEICEYAEKKLNPELKEEWTLSGYGVNIGMIRALRSTKDLYLLKWGSLKDENQTIKKSGKEIKKLIIRNDAIIKNRMKKFMGIFKNSNPDFYQDFADEFQKVKNTAAKQEAESDLNNPEIFEEI